MLALTSAISPVFFLNTTFAGMSLSLVLFEKIPSFAGRGRDATNLRSKPCRSNPIRRQSFREIVGRRVLVGMIEK
jgi:hypothetical protein